MRTPLYLSPSAINKWCESPETYYLHYLSDNSPPREIQTQPMSIGSSFDAFVKSYLHENVFGKNHTDSNRFGIDAIFEAQVEPHHRDWALGHGRYIFNEYRDSGALADLLLELQRAQTAPRFEFDVSGVVKGYRDPHAKIIGDVVLLGKPDMWYTNHRSTKIIIDWKVNGYCSKSATSPAPGYVRLRQAGSLMGKAHKDAVIQDVGGVLINTAAGLEAKKPDWARQLGIYAWLCGEEVGSEFIVGIEQVVCKPIPGGPCPQLRFAEHRNRISPDFQHQCYDLACKIWDIVHSDWIFRHMTREESIERCKLLDEQAEALFGPDADPTFTEMTRR